MNEGPVCGPCPPLFRLPTIAFVRRDVASAWTSFRRDLRSSADDAATNRETDRRHYHGQCPQTKARPAAAGGVGHGRSGYRLKLVRVKKYRWTGVTIARSSSLPSE